MSEFEILGSDESPPPPEKVERKVGRYDALIERARESDGQWVVIEARDEESARKLSGVASRINRGKMRGIESGQFEARTSIPERRMWVRRIIQPFDESTLDSPEAHELAQQ